MRPEKISIYLTTIAVIVLASAHFMQHMLDLTPCELCIWQRYPYYIILFGAVLVPLHKEMLALWMQIIALFMGLALALYHSGIERNLWEGFTSCSTSPQKGQSVEDIIAQIQSAPLTRCDQIEFTIMGLSFSNINALISLIMLLGSLYFLKQWKIYG
ncbi:MAG: disulfide bond formation protein B [Pseudomonadota bacterium]